MRDRDIPPRPAVAVCVPGGFAGPMGRSGAPARIASLTAAWLPVPDGAGRRQVLVLGRPGLLPAIWGGAAVLGRGRADSDGLPGEPGAPESALRRIVGAGPDDLTILDDQGHELIPPGVPAPEPCRHPTGTPRDWSRVRTTREAAGHE